MLPMLFGPASTGEIVPRDVIIPLPTPEYRESWQIAASIALAFWHRASSDARFSDSFRDTCARAAANLQRAIAHMALG